MPRNERSGKADYYRDQDVRSRTSVEFGEKALARIEAYLTETIENAFN
jgi:hypothetical protein